jgi:hypothetical protein
MSVAGRIYRAFFDPGSVREHCPYTGTLPAEALLLAPDDRDVARLARDRVVFYGASLEGAQDKSFTPVNGLQANVYVHAMALDNLISFAGRPYENVMEAGSFIVSNNPAQILAIIPVIIILSWIHMTRIRRGRLRVEAQTPGERSATFEYVIDKIIEKVWHYFAFALALGVGLLLALAVGLSVANWVEVVFVSVELAAMLLLGVPDSVWGYIHHVAGGRPDMAAQEQPT